MAEDCCETNEKKETTEGELYGNVTCPECRHVQKMKMPTNMCAAFYKCDGCKKTISARKSCCVFCDYGDRACPVATQHKQ